MINISIILPYYEKSKYYNVQCTIVSYIVQGYIIVRGLLHCTELPHCTDLTINVLQWVTKIIKNISLKVKPEM
jgi:hypothetical protein